MNYQQSILLTPPSQYAATSKVNLLFKSNPNNLKGHTMDATTTPPPPPERYVGACHGIVRRTGRPCTVTCIRTIYQGQSFHMFCGNHDPRNKNLKKRGQKKTTIGVCTICLEDIGDAYTSLTTCNHRFHTNCLDTWNETNSTCPNCRARVQDKDLIIVL